MALLGPLVCGYIPPNPTTPVGLEEEAALTTDHVPQGELEPPPVTSPEVAGGGGRRINEDWAATIVGLALVVLVLAGVIGKALVP
jgi:hypothetical protein